MRHHETTAQRVLRLTSSRSPLAQVDSTTEGNDSGMVQLEDELGKKNARVQALTRKLASLETKFLQMEEERLQQQDDYRRAVEGYRKSSHRSTVLDKRLQQAVASLQKAEEENASLNERMDALRAVNRKLERRLATITQQYQASKLEQQNTATQLDHYAALEEKTLQMEQFAEDVTRRCHERVTGAEQKTMALESEVQLLGDAASQQEKELVVLRIQNQQLSHWATVGESAVREIQDICATEAGNSSNVEIKDASSRQKSPSVLQNVRAESAAIVLPTTLPTPTGMAEALVQAAADGDEDGFVQLFSKLCDSDKADLLQVLGSDASDLAAQVETLRAVELDAILLNDSGGK